MDTSLIDGTLPHGWNKEVLISTFDHSGLQRALELKPVSKMMKLKYLTLFYKRKEYELKEYSTRSR